MRTNCCRYCSTLTFHVIVQGYRTPRAGEIDLNPRRGVVHCPFDDLLGVVYSVPREPHQRGRRGLRRDYVVRHAALDDANVERRAAKLLTPGQRRGRVCQWRWTPSSG